IKKAPTTANATVIPTEATVNTFVIIDRTFERAAPKRTAPNCSQVPENSYWRIAYEVSDCSFDVRFGHIIGSMSFRDLNGLFNQFCNEPANSSLKSIKRLGRKWLWISSGKGIFGLFQSLIRCWILILSTFGHQALPACR